MRCVESLTAVGLSFNGKGKTSKPSLISSFFKAILPKKADAKEKEWPREYIASNGASAQLKQTMSAGSDHDTLQVGIGVRGGWGMEEGGDPALLI